MLRTARKRVPSEPEPPAVDLRPQPLSHFVATGHRGEFSLHNIYSDRRLPGLAKNIRRAPQLREFTFRKKRPVRARADSIRLQARSLLSPRILKQRELLLNGLSHLASRQIAFSWIPLRWSHDLQTPIISWSFKTLAGIAGHTMTSRSHKIRPRHAPLFAVVAAALMSAGAADSERAEDAGPAAGNSPNTAHLIRVPLPIVGEVDSRVKAMIERLLAQWEQQDRGPILVLEFRASEEARGSQFERALSLARFLASDRMSRVRTIAYLTGPVEGHAVLPVLACEEIIVTPDATLGRAGVDEPFLDATIRSGYEEIAVRRRTVRVPIVKGMLDKELTVYRVETLEGVRYALDEELASLRESAVVQSVETVIPAGDFGVFTGNELRVKFGFASHLARDLRELSMVLGLPDGAIEMDPALGDDRRGLRVDVTGPIRADRITWIERSVRDQIDTGKVNFVFLRIDSPGGAPAESVRLANYLASLDPSKVRTVAMVDDQARADAALIAVACDQMYMTDDAVLGGPGAKRLTEKRLADLRLPIKEIAKTKNRGWSLPMALLDDSLEVYRFEHRGTGETRYFAEEEWKSLAENESWQRGPIVATAAGLDGREAVEVGLARETLTGLDELKQIYDLPAEMQGIRSNWAHQMISFLARPEVAGALLFIGWFALMIEFASPGVGLAGFTAGLCFVLFFWANYLNGTAGLLEILLFITGVVFLGLEVFVLPGFGVFGVGGGLLVVFSIVLASQTFVIPTNTYEIQQVPKSLFLVIAAALGIVAAMIFGRHILTQAPIFRRLALESSDEQFRQETEYRESLVHWEYLIGKRGVATTPLRPGGKARFGDEMVDVITGGEIIDTGTDIVVQAVHGNEVVVRPLQQS